MLYKSDKGAYDAATPPDGGFKSAMEHWPFGTDARQPAEKPLHEAVADRASLLPLIRQDMTQGQWSKGRLEWGFRGVEGRKRAEALDLLDFAGHWPT